MLVEKLNIVKYAEEKGWLDQLNIFFKSKYGVSFEHVAYSQKVEIYNFWMYREERLPEGRCYLKEKRVLLQDTSLCGINPHIDLGLIVHEFSHVAQYMTGVYNKLNRSTLSKIWNCNCFRSKSHRHNFYWNNPVEIDARESVARFSEMFGYKELSGGDR